MTMGFVFIITCMCFFTPLYQAQHPSATISDLSFKNMDFAMKLYRQIASYNDKNIFFSPLSISTSFTALLLASDGVTHEELLKGLNLEQLERVDQPAFIPRLFQLLHENITQNGSREIDQNMALFMHKCFEVERTFKDQVKEFFDADVKIVDFSDTKRTIGVINEYIKHKSKDKVNEMISTLDPMTQLMFINTVFFQGKKNHFCIS